MKRCLAIGFLLVVAGPAAAQCTGTVRGLSPYYNPATGSGFLAVRAGPSTRAPQIGELFNGERVSIGEGSGPWVRVMGKVDGWAHRNWLSIVCGGPAPTRQPPMPPPGSDAPPPATDPEGE